MIWRDAGASVDGEIDAERELELRLVAHARAGAAWALSSLVARYQPPVVRYLIRLTGDQERAYTLAEQVFIRMARRLRGPQRGEHLRLWLLRTCTDVGLDVLRRPAGDTPAQLNAPNRAPALPPGKARKGNLLGVLRAIGTLNRSRHTPRLAPPTQEFVWADALVGQNGHAQTAEVLSPREQVRHRLIRAVLAELTYSDAQCLALHLVAGLNQTEVALALGVTAPVARRRIVQGLQLFGRRYEATLASLGLPKDFADADVANVRFTQSGAVIERVAVPDETGTAEAESDEETARRREREVTGSLVVPPEALPVLEEFFAQEPAAPAPGEAEPTSAVGPTESAPALPGPLDAHAADMIFSALASSEPPDIALGEAASDATAQLDAEVESQPARYADNDETAAEPAEVILAATPPLESAVSARAAEKAPAESEDTTPAAQALADEPMTFLALEETQADLATPARTVPVLAAVSSVSRARLTHPFATTPDAEPEGAAAPPPNTAKGGGEPGRDDDELLIEWGSNPQIPIHVRSDLNAVLTQPDAVATSELRDDSDWLLVVEDERDDNAAASLESRRRRILSADGEAEDPDESVW